MTRRLTEDIEWRDDCQGKKDYDGALVSVSSRTYPQGGGYSTFGPEGWQGNDARPHVPPSGVSFIYIGDKEVARLNPTGDRPTIHSAVEEWAEKAAAICERALLDAVKRGDL